MRSGPLRVAMIVPSLRGGGLERVTADLCVALSERPVVVQVFALGGLGVHANRLLEHGVLVHDCSGSRWRIRGYPSRLISALSEYSPDILHAHSGTWLPSRVASAVLRRPKLIFTEHGRYPPEPFHRAVVERWCARGSARVVAVSEATATYLQAFLKLSTRPQVIANGVDLSAFRRNHEDRATLRAEWGVADDELVVAAVGRLVPVKNHEMLLRALAQARRAGARVRLVLAGTGPLEQRLRDVAAEVQVTAAVRFLGFREDVARVLSAADVFALTSTTEGLPISLLEAISCSLPVVATAVGGIPDALGDPPAGVLIASGDEEALGTALERLAVSSASREELVKRGVGLLQQYDIQKHAEAYRSLYESVAMGTGGAARMDRRP